MINNKNTEYGFLVGSYIFNLVPVEKIQHYKELMDTLPNPIFEEVTGHQGISYFKKSAISLTKPLLEIIEQGCKEKSVEGVTFSIIEKTIDSRLLNNILYEDEYQVISLKEGTTIFRDLMLLGD
ncbi:hypothetical protein [Viridibacillus arvi]|uniref:hypothetical protein n=1 Tax=Viridibacillus arvi TaxID=263475 RepID=UPI0034CE62C2